MSPGCLNVASAVQRTPLAFAVLFCAASFGGERAPDTKDDWLHRLLLHTEQLLGDEQLAKHDRVFVLSLACSTLGRAGRAEQAIEWAREHSNLVRWQLSLQLVAAAQSESDDVPGALRTAELVDDPALRQRTLVLVVVRQAQRGDDADAVALLGRVTDARERQRALEQIIDARLERGLFADAAQLMKQVVDSEIRGRLEKNAQRIREKPLPGDADFTDRTVALAKEDWGFLGFGKTDEEFLRRACRAEVALYNKDWIAFSQAMDRLKHCASECSGVERRNATMRIAMLYHRSGDQEAARRSYEKVLASFLEPPKAMDCVRIGLSTGNFFDTLVQVMPGEDVERWIVRLVRADDVGKCDTTDLIGGIAGAMALRQDIRGAERIYEQCTAPRQRFRVCVEVLDALEKRRQAQSSRPNLRN